MIAPSQDAVGTLSTRSAGLPPRSFTWSSGRSHTTSMSPASSAATFTPISGMTRSSTPSSFGRPGSK